MNRSGPHCPTATLLVGKNAGVHGTGVCWALKAVRTFWCRDISVVLAEIRILDRPASSLGTVPTELTRNQGKANRLHLKDKKSAAVITISRVRANTQMQTQ